MAGIVDRLDAIEDLLMSAIHRIERIESELNSSNDSELKIITQQIEIINKELFGSNVVNTGRDKSGLK